MPRSFSVSMEKGLTVERAEDDTPEPLFLHPTATITYVEPLSTPHTVSVLLLALTVVIYVLRQHDEGDDVANIKMGVLMAVIFGLVFCMEHLRDTLFMRPHPAIWRLATGIGFCYALFLTFSLFQSADTVRAMLKHIDPRLTGNPLPQRDCEYMCVSHVPPRPYSSYILTASDATACSMTYENVMAVVKDEFFVAHLLGWMFKSVMLRDVCK